MIHKKSTLFSKKVLFYTVFFVILSQKTKVFVFDFHSIFFVRHKISFEKYLGFALLVRRERVGYVIKIVAQDIEKRIYEKEVVFDIDNSNHNKDCDKHDEHTDF